MNQPIAPCVCRNVEMKVPSVTGSLPLVRAVAEKMSASHGAGDEDVLAIGLAIDEALANVIKHGYGGAPDQPIEVSLEVDCEEGGPRLTVMIRDFGRQVDPATIRGRDLDDVRPGGLGVHIIRSVMDHVEYSCPEYGGMTVTMVKRIGGRKP